MSNIPKNSKFRIAQMVIGQSGSFWASKWSKLISRKIWVAEKYLNFHTVNFSCYANFRQKRTPCDLTSPSEKLTFNSYQPLDEQQNAATIGKNPYPYGTCNNEFTKKITDSVAHINTCSSAIWFSRNRKVHPSNLLLNFAQVNMNTVMHNDCFARA